MIAKITKAYTRRYSDNGQVTTYVEWIDAKGKSGRTEGQAPGALCRCCGSQVKATHMGALLARAAREGIEHTQEAW